MPGAAESAERLLELGDFGTAEELAMRENARDGVVHRAAEAAALGGNVDERNGIGAQMLIH
jgi:hypothetical protein